MVNTRLIAVFVLFLIWAGIVITALYINQISKGEEYRMRADRQYINPSVGQWNRGNVYAETKDGERIALATVQEGITLVGVVDQIKDPQMVADVVASYTNGSTTEIVNKIAGARNATVELGSFTISSEFIAPTSSVPGLRYLRFKEREYPQGTSTSHVIGFVGESSKDTKLAGRYGIERSFEDVLGRDPVAVYRNVFEDIFDNVHDLFTTPTSEKGDVILTIEPRVQIMLEKQVNAMYTAYGAEMAGGLILNPKTGEVLAMASSPNYDPNSFGSYDLSVFQNPLTDQVFELGSIFKPLTIAAGIDVGKIKPTTRYYDEGYVTVDDRVIANFDRKKRGWVTMQDVLDESLNTGVIFVVNTIGADVFRAYFEAYKLKEQTGIEMPGEAHNIVSNLYSGRAVDAATASFGQGVALTPISAARALSSIANNGILVDPYVVKKIVTLDGGEVIPERGTSTRVMKPETAQSVTKMMVHAVDNALLFGAYSIKNLSVAAKTGTAQIPDGKGGYSDKVLHTFVGYFPASNPQYFVFLMLKDPKGDKSEFASQTLTKYFFRLLNSIVEYYGVPGDR